MGEKAYKDSHIDRRDTALSQGPSGVASKCQKWEVGLEPLSQSLSELRENLFLRGEQLGTACVYVSIN